MNIEPIGIHHCEVQILKCTWTIKTSTFQWNKSVNSREFDKEERHTIFFSLTLPTNLLKKVCVTPTEAQKITLQTFMALFCSSH